MDTKALVTERVKLHEEEKAILDKASAEKRTLSSEEQVEFDKKDARITEIRETLVREEKQAAEARALGESRGRQTETSIVQVEQNRERDIKLAFRAWVNGRHAKRDNSEAAERIGFNHLAPEIEFSFDPLVETRALSVGTTTAGGNLVMDELTRGFFEVQKWFGSMRQVATVYRTATGGPLPIPSADDTGNVGEIISEGSAVTTTADPTFNTMSLGAFKYSSKAVIASVEFIQDSMIPVAPMLSRMLGERIGRIQNTHFTVGAGTTLPFGVAVRASLGKTAAVTNAITFDEILDLRMAVDRAYRDAPGAGFMMNDTTATALRKVRAEGTQGQYLWEMSLQTGTPDRIWGSPVYYNGDLDSPTATALRPVLYGDFREYIIRDTSDVIFIRADELRVLNHQVVFLAFQRSDGNLRNTAAVKYLRMA